MSHQCLPDLAQHPITSALCTLIHILSFFFFFFPEVPQTSISVGNKEPAELSFLRRNRLPGLPEQTTWKINLCVTHLKSAMKCLVAADVICYLSKFDLIYWKLPQYIEH